MQKKTSPACSIRFEIERKVVELRVAPCRVAPNAPSTLDTLDTLDTLGTLDTLDTLGTLHNRKQSHLLCKPILDTLTTLIPWHPGHPGNLPVRHKYRVRAGTARTHILEMRHANK